MLENFLLRSAEKLRGGYLLVFLKIVCFLMVKRLDTSIYFWKYTIYRIFILAE